MALKTAFGQWERTLAGANNAWLDSGKSRAEDPNNDAFQATQSFLARLMSPKPCRGTRAVK